MARDYCGALILGALFRARRVAALLFTVSVLCVPAQASIWPSATETDNGTQPCFANLASEYGVIERVSDGDTVVLTDGRRVRLIGINTAELNAKSNTLRSLADKARDQLSALLPKLEPVILRVGKDSHDQHGRLLAHVIRRSDRFAVAHDLLRRGLAAQVSVAPNTACSGFHTTLEAQAQSRSVGLWQHIDLWQLRAANSNPDERGFRLLIGEVTSVRKQKKHTTLLLDNAVQLRVRQSLATQLPLNELIGKTIEIRGWLGAYKSQLRMRLHHHTNLRIVEH